MAFRSAFSSLRLPTTLSALSLAPFRTQTTQSKLQATTSHFLPRPPNPSAIRESPYPLIFLRTPALSDSQSSGSSSSSSGGENESWSAWSSMFAEKGYTSIEIDINPAPYDPDPWAGMVGVLATQIRTLGIPFGPVIVASGRATLLAQAYIEDWAASGLVLINPPPDDDPRGESRTGLGTKVGGREDSAGRAIVAGGEGGRPWKWPKLRYEPHFPILVLAEENQFERLEKDNRIVRAVKEGIGRGGKGVSLEKLVDGERGDRSRTEVERWMDRCGY